MSVFSIVKGLMAMCVLVVFIYACAKPKEEGKACTESFAFITLSVRDTLDKPVYLDSNYTEIIDSKKKLIIPTDSFLIANYGYNVITDSEIKLISAQGTALRFVGYTGAKKVVDENFVVSQDGCHINRVSGANKVIAH